MTVAQYDEHTLIAALKRGESDAYAALLHRYGGRMLATARRFMGEEDLARDCVQDACVQVFRCIADFEGQSALSTWLHRIVVNAALMKLRSIKRKAEQPFEEETGAEFDAYGHRMYEPPFLLAAADELLERAEGIALTRRCIDALPDRYRNVLLLRDIEGYSTKETARALSMSEDAVKVTLHRARKALKGALQQAFEKEKTGSEAR